VQIICLLLQYYVYAIYARVLLSWIARPGSGGAMGQIVDVVDMITEPVMKPLRKVLPPVRLGSISLDLSAIVVIVGLNFLLRSALCV